MGAGQKVSECTRHARAGRILREVHRETLQGFIWHWEGTESDFREPWRPTQWTHEFPIALGELLGTQTVWQRCSPLSPAPAASTDPTSTCSQISHSTSTMAIHGLGLPSTVRRHRFTKRLRPRDVYTAAHLVRGLDNVEAQNVRESRTSADRRLAHILGASEAIHTTLEAALDTWGLRSRMATILDAFIRDVATPTLRIYGACAAVHLLLDAAKMRSPVDGARAEFISEVVAPTLRCPTDDLPHYGSFASRLRGLHALARELAGDMCLFSGEGADGAESSSAEV